MTFYGSSGAEIVGDGAHLRAIALGAGADDIAAVGSGSAAISNAHIVDSKITRATTGVGSNGAQSSVTLNRNTITANSTGVSIVNGESHVLFRE